MMDEPVVNFSDKVMNPKFGLVQITISSAKRDRCIPVMLQADKNSNAKSRAETASSEFVIGRAKPKAFAVMLRLIGKDVPASAAAPSGISLTRLIAS